MLSSILMKLHPDSLHNIIILGISVRNSSKDCLTGHVNGKQMCPRTQYMHSDYIQTTFFTLEIYQEIGRRSMLQLKRVTIISKTCPYYLLPWEWIDLKLEVKWTYQLCLIFADTVFWLCMTELLFFARQYAHARCYVHQLWLTKILCV